MEQWESLSADEFCRLDIPADYSSDWRHYGQDTPAWLSVDEIYATTHYPSGDDLPGKGEYVIYYLYEFGVRHVGYVGMTQNWRARKRVHFQAENAGCYFAKAVRRRRGCLVFEIIDTAWDKEEAEHKEWEYMDSFQARGYILANHQKPSPRRCP